MVVFAEGALVIVSKSFEVCKRPAEFDIVCLLCWVLGCSLRGAPLGLGFFQRALGDLGRQ